MNHLNKSIHIKYLYYWIILKSLLHQNDWLKWKLILLQCTCMWSKSIQSSINCMKNWLKVVVKSAAHHIGGSHHYWAGNTFLIMTQPRWINATSEELFLFTCYFSNDQLKASWWAYNQGYWPQRRIQTKNESEQLWWNNSVGEAALHFNVSPLFVCSLPRCDQKERLKNKRVVSSFHY